jgi:hypothetical protein
MDLSKLLRDVAQKVAADTAGNGEAHFQLLNAIKQLNLAAETPAETLMRMRHEVMITLYVHNQAVSCKC